MTDLNVITALQEGLCAGARVVGVILALMAAVLVIGGVTALVAMTAIELGKKEESAEDHEEPDPPRDEEGEPRAEAARAPRPIHCPPRQPIPSRR